MSDDCHAYGLGHMFRGGDTCEHCGITSGAALQVAYNTLRGYSRELEAQRDELLAALKKIADGGCKCTGYYRCNGCPDGLVYIAEEAVAKAEVK